MKKILVLAIAIVMFTFVLVACADDADEVQYDAGGNRIVRVASHNAVVEGNPYRIRYEADLREAAAAVNL